MSNAADAATGQSIGSREEIVALVIDRRTGGYPDAATHAAMPGLGPTALFEPLSLPIRGTYDEFGAIVPRKGQLAVAQVLSLTNQPDWSSFQAKAFGVDGRIALGDGARGVVHPIWGKGDGHRERTLGLAIYRKATWDLAVGLSHERDRDGDVAAVLDGIARIRALSAAGDNDGAMRNAGLLSLTQGAFHGTGGSREDLPRLARALSHREGGDLLGPLASEWLARDRGGLLGYGLLDRDADPALRGLLEAIWELHAAEDGFETLGRTYGPSQLVGGYQNGPDVFALGVSMLGEAGRATLSRHEESPENPALDRLAGMLDRLDDLRAELASGIARIRDGYGEDDLPAPGR